MQGKQGNLGVVEDGESVCACTIFWGEKWWGKGESEGTLRGGWLADWECVFSVTTEGD